MNPLFENELFVQNFINIRAYFTEGQTTINRASNWGVEEDAFVYLHLRILNSERDNLISPKMISENRNTKNIKIIKSIKNMLEYKILLSR